MSFKLFKILFCVCALIGFAMPNAMATKDFNVKNNSQSFLFVNGTSGNVGIGSTAPGKTLDVQGTVRATAFVGDGSALTGINSSQWATQNTTDVSLAGGNVGIGTTLTTTSALTVMNGNVGIGTWVPANLLDVKGNIGISTTGGIVENGNQI